MTIPRRDLNRESRCFGSETREPGIYVSCPHELDLYLLQKGIFQAQFSLLEWFLFTILFIYILDTSKYVVCTYVGGVCVCLLFSSSRETARKKLNHISISSWFRLFNPVRYCCITPLLEYIPWDFRPQDNLTDLLIISVYLPSLIWRVEKVNQVCLNY